MIRLDSKINIHSDENPAGSSKDRYNMLTEPAEDPNFLL